MSGSARMHLAIQGKQLETAMWEMSAPVGTILLLHEALGSVTYWKDFPEHLARVTGHNVIAYSRAGHGDSEGPVDARSVAYYRHQVEVVVPAILDHFNVKRPVLYGHSEGAAIAFIYAAEHAAEHAAVDVADHGTAQVVAHGIAAPGSVQAVIAECPIFVQEEQTVRTIEFLESSYAGSDMGRKLKRYHRDADAVFQGWMESNRSALFTDFPLQQYLRKVRSPVLVLQGQWDEFGTELQFQALQQDLPEAQHVSLDAGHLLHREQPDLVAAHVRAFLAQTDSAGAGVTIHVDSEGL